VANATGFLALLIEGAGGLAATLTEWTGGAKG
jgi:hypothetical protein